MSPLFVVLPKGKSPYVVLRPSGELIFPADAPRQRGWTIGTKLRVCYLDNPLILFLARAGDEPGFTLHRIGHDDSGEGACKIRIAKLVKDVVRLRVKLPQLNLQPIHLPPSDIHDQELAIQLEPWAWADTTFDMAGAESLPSKTVGLYEILANDGSILKVGEGVLNSRLREAMKITDLARSGRIFRYLTLEKPDAELLEQVALTEYRQQNGQLPPFNRINQ